MTRSFLKAVFHKYYLVHSWILCHILVSSAKALLPSSDFLSCFQCSTSTLFDHKNHYLQNASRWMQSYILSHIHVIKLFVKWFFVLFFSVFLWWDTAEKTLFSVKDYFSKRRITEEILNGKLFFCVQFLSQVLWSSCNMCKVFSKRPYKNIFRLQTW